MISRRESDRVLGIEFDKENELPEIELKNWEGRKMGSDEENNEIVPDISGRLQGWHPFWTL